MCIDMSGYEVAETTKDGLQILRKKPYFERQHTPGEYLTTAIGVVLLFFALYGITLILNGLYKLVVKKDKNSKPAGKKQIKKGLLIFFITFVIWALINLAVAFLGVNTLCLNYP